MIDQNKHDISYLDPTSITDATVRTYRRLELDEANLTPTHGMGTAAVA